MPVLTSNNTYGIYLESSSKNTLSGNMMTGNTYNFNLDGSIDSDFDNQIDKSNLVDGRPIYYIIKVSDMIYDSSSKAGTFYCISCLNVTLRNLNLNKNGKGIYFWNTSQSRIQNVSASNDGYGIYLYYSSNNKLSGNIMTGNQVNFNLDGYTDSDFDNHIDKSNLVDGKPIYYIIKASDSTYDSSSNAGTFYCISCVNVTIKNLNLNKNGKGIYLWNTYQSKIQNVNASNNTLGIYLSSSSNNTISGNNASSNSETGIRLYSSSDNTISGNYASFNSETGIYLYSSSKNTLSGNMMTGNTYNFNLDGSIDSDFDNQIDKSNLVDGRPIYYIIKVSDMIYDSSSKAGTFYCISCLNVTLRNLNLNKNGKGIYFWNTSQSRIQNVSASNDGYGISLYYSSNNKLSGNNASNNGYSGIYLVSSSNNTLTGNNTSKNNGYYWGSGIFLDSSNNNTLTGNNASNNGNDISYYGYGITLRSSSNNKLSGNIMTGNQVNFNLDGYTDSDFDNHIDKSNLVDGKPIYYIIKASDST